MTAPYASAKEALEHEKSVVMQFTDLVCRTMLTMNAAGIPGKADTLPEMVERLIKERDHHRTWARQQNDALQEVARTLKIKAGQELISTVNRRVRRLVRDAEKGVR